MTSTDTEHQPKWTVAEGETIPVTVMRRSYVGRCWSCGFIALGHEYKRSAQSEIQKHHQAEHPDEYPKHDDGSTCFHTAHDCTEHGSCMDCDACKRFCECN